MIEESKATRAELTSNKAELADKTEIIDTLKKEAEELKSVDTTVTLFKRKYEEEKSEKEE